MTARQPDDALSSVRLGAIAFVNTVPIYSDFRTNVPVALCYDVPAQLNARMLAGGLDVSPVSSACYLRNQDRLVLLDDLSVSSPGAVESVIFLSRKPLGPDMLDFSVVSVPDDSETSVMLLAYLLREATGQDFRPWFQSYHAADYELALQQSGNALVIGDNALILQEKGIPDGVYCYDLSTLWQARTGLPFVFAVWVADRHWADSHPQHLHVLNADLRAARNRFFAEPSVFENGVRVARQRSVLPVDTLERYYRQCLQYDLSVPHQESLKRFGQIIRQAEDWRTLATLEAQEENVLHGQDVRP